MKGIFCIFYNLLLASPNLGFTFSEEPSKYPSFVHLDIMSHSAHLFCGGTYIHQHWVLTAAHCLDDTLDGPPAVGQPDRVTLYMGVTRYKGGPRQKRTSTVLILHDSYVSNHEQGRPFSQSKQKQFDLGLIGILTPFNVNEHVDVAKLATELPQRPRLLAMTHSLNATEVIGCQQVDNTAIVTCQEAVDVSTSNRLYNGGPLYIRDTKEVIGIVISTLDEDYGVLITDYRAWMEDTFKLHIGDKVKTGLQPERVPDGQPQVRRGNAADLHSLNSLRLMNMLLVIYKCIY